MSSILPDEVGMNSFHGFTPNYIRVEMENAEQLNNQIVQVRMGEMNEEQTALKGLIL